MAGSCSAASSLAHVHYVIRNPHLATTSTSSIVSNRQPQPYRARYPFSQLTTTRAATMFAARSRAVCTARQLQRTCRNYASDAHGHGHHHSAAPVNESFGKGSVFAVAAFLGTVLVYQFRPQETDNWNVSNLLTKYRSKAEDWETINALHTKAMEQAGYDRNLFENASNKHRFVDVAFPEAFQSHAQRNIQAGHLVNIDHVVEHYRQQHLKAEEKKVAKLAAAGKQE
ncbi:hypothetical protein HDV57DRAFT_480387 [Trichoderma longibrachiatum]